MKPLKVSVCIPLYNEEEVFPLLVKELIEVLSRLVDTEYEIIFVEDGSSDGTPELLAREVERTTCIRAIFLSRNFGHQAALTAALDHADGDIVITMDGDLQDPPQVIPALIEKYKSGYEVVHVVRKSRDASMSHRFLYWLFYRVLNKFSRVSIPLDSGDFALLSRRVVETLGTLGESHRFLRGLRAWVGFRQTSIAVDRPARSQGITKYSWLRLCALAADGILSLSISPLRIAMLMGLVATALSLIFVTYAIYLRLFFAISPDGFTALLTVCTFFGGIHLVSLGIVGEYVGRIYEQTKNRPHYIIDKMVN